MSSFKEYCYEFVDYLIQQNAIINNSISRVEADAHYQAFRHKFNSREVSFWTVWTALQNYYLVSLNKKYLNFKEGVLKRITARHASSQISSSAQFCKICQVMVDRNIYDVHIQSERHLLLARYVNNRNLLVNSIVGLSIEVENNRGCLEEIILLRVNEAKDILLKVRNDSGNDYAITEIIEILPRATIKIQKTNLPNIENGTQLTFKINAHFHGVVYASYPLVFRFKDLKLGTITDALKNLIFHVHSGVVDDLHAIKAFEKLKISQDVPTRGGIVQGEHMKRSANNFNPIKPLQQYHMTDSFLGLLMHNLHQFEGMNHEQKLMLNRTRSILSNYKMKDAEKLTERSYYEMLRLLLFLEEYQLKLDIKKYALEDGSLFPVKGYHKHCLELKVPGLAEHRPSLLKGDSVLVMENKDSRIKYEGIVHETLQDSVVLGFSYKFINKVHIQNKKYYISFGFNRVPLRAEHQAIELLRNHGAISLLCRDIFQIKPLKNHDLVWFNKSIENNLQQQQAVRHILSQTSAPMPYLVFGPPGTGKTATIVEAVLQVWKLQPSKHILISAPTNTAADEVAKRIVKFVPKRDLLRYVAPSYPYKLLYEEVKPFVNYREDEFYHPTNATLLTYRIIVTTLVTASRLINGGTPKGHFDYVFIDESGQATESETLIPIAGILTSHKTPGAINGQIVLAGDPKQLGPIIHSFQAIKYGFDISMLERLMKDNNAYKKNEQGHYKAGALTKLVLNYRSHEEILAVPNKLFYDSDLIPAANKEMTNIAIDWEHLPNPKFPVVFHSVFGKDERELNSPSFFNVEEIEITLQYLSLLIGAKLHGMKISEEHIGIITPYRKQVQKMQQACKKVKYGEKLLIGSVEQFQGQERLIIILSTVRSRPEFTPHDAKFHLGFLRNPKRFNVAITRAKALLIVIGNPKILLLDPHWYEFISYCRKNGSTPGEPFDLLPFVPNSTPNISMDDDLDLVNDSEECANFARGRQ